MSKGSKYPEVRPDVLDRGELSRLIPVTADSNKEARAASILLSTFMAVPAFAREVFSTIGQRVGTRSGLTCFTEIHFKKEKDNGLRPDGLIVLEGGRGQTWHCVVEAKIGNAELTSKQVEDYLAVAKRNNIQAVLTLSNQFVARPDHSPVKVSKTLLRSTELYHWSWNYLLTAAKLLLNEDVFETKEQRYVLQEFARYFSHQSSGVNRFIRMNSEWREICSQVISRTTLNKTSPVVENTVGAWHQESRDVCLLMCEKLNRPVKLYLSRSHENDPSLRLKDDVEHLVKNFELKHVLDIPDAVSPLLVSAHLRTRVVTVSMSLTAPKDKQRAVSRISWLVKQLAKSNPEDIYIRCNWPGRTPSTQAKLTDVQENPEALIQGNTGTPMSFDVLLIRDLAGRFSGTSTFIEDLEAAVPHFYSEVGQHLRPYLPPAPAIKKDTPKPEPELKPDTESKSIAIKVIAPDETPEEAVPTQETT